ncbi:NADPH-dependent FMN reductase [Salipiger sp.]|uniref:NADPH-dependent FMN reductase n=1 Tax=Salipiger sp. TaxID=2078585 RepID=UPI003A970070
MPRILLIMASVRASRIGDQIADWIHGRNDIGLDIETVDLRDWPLPMDDEPHQPKQKGFDGYTQEHTRAWSRKVGPAAGFIFLVPQYNWGYPAALKNALDHLYHEWQYKPAIIVSYGSRGGGKAADQIAQVFQGLHIQPVDTRPALPLKDVARTGADRLADPAAAFAGQEAGMRAALGQLAEALAQAPAGA